MNIFYPDFYYEKIVDIKPEFLNKNGVKFILIDIDDTIAKHNLPSPIPEFKPWLKRILGSGIKAALVSNNYRKNRVALFAKNLNLPFSYFSLKPTHLGIKRALKMIGGNKNDCALIGDQIFTDIMGANIYGIKSILVSPLSLKKNFLSRVKRLAEKPILRKIKKNKNFSNE